MSKCMCRMRKKELRSVPEHETSWQTECKRHESRDFVQFPAVPFASRMAPGTQEVLTAHLLNERRCESLRLRSQGGWPGSEDEE